MSRYDGGAPPVVILSTGQVTKIDAARRQLDSAIGLFFSQGDPIAVATLAYNALEISATLARQSGAFDWTTFEDVAQSLGTTGAEARRIVHHPRNFFKHADRDQDDVLPSWTDNDIEHLLALTVIQFGEVAERSAEMWSALIWYYATHPDVKAPSGGGLEELVNEFSYLATLERAERLAQRSLVLDELRRRAR